jgi:transposase
MKLKGPQALERLRDEYRAGASTNDIAVLFEVSEVTARRWMRNLRVFGRPYAPKGTVQGRPRLLTFEQSQVSEVSVYRPTLANLTLVGPPLVPL